MSSCGGSLEPLGLLRHDGSATGDGRRNVGRFVGDPRFELLCQRRSSADLRRAGYVGPYNVGQASRYGLCPRHRAGRDESTGRRCWSQSCGVGAWRELMHLQSVSVTRAGKRNHGGRQGGIKSADTTGPRIDIPGFGDSAIGVSKGPVASVWFSKGDTMVAIVVVRGSSGGPFIDEAKGVARAALGRL